MSRIALCALALWAADVGAELGPGLADLGRARSYGMGGAYRALGGGTEVVEGNPAALGVQKRYLIELGGGWDPKNPFGFGSLGVLDAVTSPLAAGLSYHLISLGSGEEQRTAHLNTGAFSLPVGGVLHLGASVRHVLMTGSRSANALTGDAGVLLQLGPVALTAAGHNLIDIHNPDFPRYYSAAVGFGTPLFSLAVDARARFGEEENRFAFHAGGEYVVGQLFPVRLGYSHDGLRQARTVTGGLGLFVENGSVELAYQYELRGSFSRLLAITFRMLVQ